MPGRIALKTGFIMLALLWLGACGGKAMEMPIAGEMMKGPGLFSGPAGGFVFGSSKAKADD